MEINREIECFQINAGDRLYSDCGVRSAVLADGELSGRERPRLF